MLTSLSRSWGSEIDILKDNFNKLITDGNSIGHWGILLEYDIPRRAKRIDAVIVTDKNYLIVEFKIGSDRYVSAHIQQLIDYCKDLVSFHLESRDKSIVPILVSTESNAESFTEYKSNTLVQAPTLVNKNSLADAIKKIEKELVKPHNSGYKNWENSKYLPTPSIIEAAQELFEGHNVFEILHNTAGKDNLKRTCDRIFDIINYSKQNERKSICFVTGVPGAGKTLVGLTIIHNKELYKDVDKFGTYLSGNSPLVKVLSKALNSNTLIQNVHKFLDHLFENKQHITDEEVIVFDEAQRAWNAEHSNRKFSRPHSEAEMMFEIMSRKEKSAVVIALIGNGQEINTGEAGLEEWGKALTEKFNQWDIYVSPLLLSKNENSPYQYLFETIPGNLNITVDKSLHLDVSLRAIRSQKIADWVEKVLNGESEKAKHLYSELIVDYPLYLTRNLDTAKKWLKYETIIEKDGPIEAHRLGRYGLIATSGARRLKAFGLDVKGELDEAEWFLNDRNDVRSSYYLEQPATEFSIQGLEIDWACLCWGEDLRRINNQWSFHKFRGTKWSNTRKNIDKTYTLNKYRVLLTRAREGMIIWVPIGSDEDHTRKPEYNEGTYNYLKSCGIKEI